MPNPVKNKRRPPSLPGFVIAVFYPKLVRAAKRCGYALTIHGSLQRDIDLVAIPWTDQAVAPATLVRKLRKVVRDPGHEQVPEAKPHGRIAYTLTTWAGGVYFDLSIMPRQRRRKVNSCT
jgi:hypothetical protein